MLRMAKQRGWIGHGIGSDLEKLLLLMLDESDPRLPFGYIKLDEVSFGFFLLLYGLILHVSF